MKSKIKKLDADTYEVVYVPMQQGHYVVTVTYGGQHITKSPFKVEVGPYKESRIRAYGPGLEGGVVNQPAVFTVETNGETGALGKLYFLSDLPQYYCLLEYRLLCCHCSVVVFFIVCYTSGICLY